MHNVFYHYLINDHYFIIQSRFTFVEYDDDDSKNNDIIYLLTYVTCLEAKFYDYLASNDVKIK
jgi:hypothetical protein